MENIVELNENIVTDRYTTILQAAERLFGEKGYRGVSIDEIAKAAGVSKGLVLYHFSSKKALLEHILKEGVAALLKDWDAVVQSDEKAQVKIRGAIQAFLNLLNSRPYLLRIVFSEGFFVGEPKDIIMTIGDDIRRRVALLLDEGIAKGEFRRVDSQIAAILLLGMITGLTLQAITQQPLLTSSDQAADEITELFCQGLNP